MPTRKEFLTLYQEQLKLVHSWANDPAELAEFIKRVETVLNDWKGFDKHRWNYASKTAYAAWHGVGERGLPTLTKLRAMPLTACQALAYSLPSPRVGSLSGDRVKPARNAKGSPK